ncbi:hypothetical protein Q4578_14115 [Shimia thalassica]|jgi:hypothetical protein|uniref:Uncharacterized protein n=1 Tax=Shimia thalassica TaxID=1715693 RepID=A0A0P1ICH9_9RHOB|nr:hypothetical protein [Shimia thalassica]PHO04932.1 hypothetical protein CSC82_05285 [Rhodobacteraceae bacterium 4F10]MBU2941269.1 hypothetical protein [Shimia thalassica]MDO6481602.1 hypothetical protein [Shimia thalassica]MDO6483949.1 hypothetical protein [Shimia thalassica]MDO6503246.1 hypothetical protein [Shimia thalassica]
MTTFLPKDVQAGLDAARKKSLKKSSKLRVEVDGHSFRVLKFREDGFSLDVENAPRLRGLVDLYDGGRHLSQCLIVASEEEGDLMHYEFKRATAASERAPVDFYRGENAPVALITQDS